MMYRETQSFKQILLRDHHDIKLTCQLLVAIFSLVALKRV